MATMTIRKREKKYEQMSKRNMLNYAVLMMIKVLDHLVCSMFVHLP